MKSGSLKLVAYGTRQPVKICPSSERNNAVQSIRPRTQQADQLLAKPNHPDLPPLAGAVAKPLYVRNHVSSGSNRLRNAPVIDDRY